MGGLMSGAGFGLSSFMDSFNQTKERISLDKLRDAAQKRQTMQDVLAQNKYEMEKQAAEDKAKAQSITRMTAGLMAQGFDLKDIAAQIPQDQQQYIDWGEIATVSKNMQRPTSVEEINGQMVLVDTSSGSVVRVLGKARGFAPTQTQYDLFKDAEGNAHYVPKGSQVPQGYQKIGDSDSGGYDVKNEGALRKEFNTGATTFQKITEAYKNIETLAKQQSAAGDLGLIFAIMKMFDPTSTVREGEFATAQNAAGVPAQVLNQYNRVMTGERLNPTQRQDFVNTAKNIYSAQRQEFTKHVQRYTDISKEYGYDPRRIISNFGDIPPAPQLDTMSTPNHQNADPLGFRGGL